MGRRNCYSRFATRLLAIGTGPIGAEVVVIGTCLMIPEADGGMEGCAVDGCGRKIAGHVQVAPTEKDGALWIVVGAGTDIAFVAGRLVEYQRAFLR